MGTVLSSNPQVQAIITKLLHGEGMLSFSSLSAFAESPKDFIDYKLGKRVETEAMVYGSMVHCLVLEPQDFDKRYHAIDDADICVQIGGSKPRATKAYKEWKAVALQEAGDRILVNTEDYNHAKIVAQNVVHNAASSKVLHLCPQRETPIEWEHLNFKFRGIRDMSGEKAVADLKTCPDASPRKFWRSIFENGYHIQAAMYLHGSGMMGKKYYIVAVDKKGGVSVHKLPERLIEIGMQKYTSLVQKFNDCIVEDSFDMSYDFWSERYDGTFEVEIPGYIFS